MTMIDIPEDMLVAYVDGALAPDQQQALARLEASNHEFGERARAYRQLKARLAAAFDPVLLEPTPARLLEAARRKGGATVLPFGRSVKLRPALLGAMALAASLLIGILIGGIGFEGRSPGGALVADASGLRAGGRLAVSLESQASGGAMTDGIGVLMSFRRTDGGFCRVFRLGGSGKATGLACREESAHWRVLALEALGGAAVEAGIRPAGAESLPPVLQARVIAIMEGDPLGREQERSALQAGWRHANRQ